MLFEDNNDVDDQPSEDSDDIDERFQPDDGSDFESF